MGRQIHLQGLKIAVRALPGCKQQGHKPAGGIVDEHQQRAGRAKLAMLRPVDLYQFTETLTADPALVKTPAQ